MVNEQNALSISTWNYLCGAVPLAERFLRCQLFDRHDRSASTVRTDSRYIRTYGVPRQASRRQKPKEQLYRVRPRGKYPNLTAVNLIYPVHQVARGLDHNAPAVLRYNWMLIHINTLAQCCSKNPVCWEFRASREPLICIPYPKNPRSRGRRGFRFVSPLYSCIRSKH